MKTLDEINEEIKVLNEKILCQEIGNDSYYLSAQYHEQLLQLEALKIEADVLSGKIPPVYENFDKYPPEKQAVLKKITESRGIYFASNYKDLPLKDLLYLENLMKKN